jgi:hypothetical protein
MHNKKWSSRLRISYVRQKYSENQKSTIKLETDKLCFFLEKKKRRAMVMERILLYHCRMDEEVSFYSLSF